MKHQTKSKEEAKEKQLLILLELMQKRTPKDNKSNKQMKESVISLEATEHFDDQKPIYPEQSLVDVNNEESPPEVDDPKANTKRRAKANAQTQIIKNTNLDMSPEEPVKMKNRKPPNKK